MSEVQEETLIWWKILFRKEQCKHYKNMLGLDGTCGILKRKSLTEFFWKSCTGICENFKLQERKEEVAP